MMALSAQGPGAIRDLTSCFCHLLFKTSPAAPDLQGEHKDTAQAVLTTRGQCKTAQAREVGQ